MRRTALAPSLLVIAALASVLPAGAARGEQQAISLAQAVEHSRQKNGDLVSLRQEKGVHDAELLRAGLLPNPTLDLEAATGALTGSSAENSVGIGISQDFLLAGKRGKRLSVAGREIEAYRWQVAERQRALTEEVKGAFYDAVLAKERVALAERSMALRKRLLEVAKDRLAAGDIPELEMNLVKVELARAEGTRIEAAKGLVQAQARLWSLMGLPPGAEPAISGNLEGAAELTATIEELKALARGKRPDLKALEAERAKGEAEIVLARAEGVPDLKAGLVARREATSMEIGGVEGRDTAYTIGVTLSIPIPLFHRNGAGIQEATAKRDVSETRLAFRKKEVEREVASAYASYRNSLDILSLYRGDIMPQLEENLKLTQEAYSLGEVGVLAVIDEQKKFYEVSDGYLTALHGRQTALVRLEASVGGDFTGGGK